MLSSIWEKLDADYWVWEKRVKLICMCGYFSVLAMVAFSFVLLPVCQFLTKPCFTNNNQKWVLRVNPLHSNISMHILLTVLSTFPKVLTGRICNNQELLYLLIISFIPMTLLCDSGMMLWGEITCRCYSILVQGLRLKIK